MPERENNHSVEVHEILGTPPGWIVRWGITIVLTVIVVILAGTWFYKYPDMIPSRITILSANPPVQIVARETGKIDMLFVNNNQKVSEGGTLAVIGNTANYSDACSLLYRLNVITDIFFDPVKFRDIKFREDYMLGQYHSHYSSFISQLKSYQTFLTYNPYDQRIGTLEKQMEDYQDYIRESEAQIAILKQDFELSGSRFFRDSVLFTQRIMTPSDYEQSKAEMLKQKFSYQNAVTGLAGTQIIVNNLEQQVNEQKILKAEAENLLLATLKEKYDNLKNQLIGWEQSFVLKTPVSGQITFTNFWSVNQFVTTGDIVFTVVPLKEQQIVGRAEVPIMGAGKVAPGQKVNIKLDNFPHLEYGLLEGKVVNISKVPVTTEKGSYYTVEVDLVNDMITNYNKELLFSQEMQGNAEIITKDRRMIQRLIEPLVSRYRENVSVR